MLLAAVPSTLRRTRRARQDSAIRTSCAALESEESLPTRRAALALSLGAVSTLSVQRADAAGVELGLRRSGRSKKFSDVPADAYTTLPSGLKVYDVVVGNGKVVGNGDRAVVHYDCKWRSARPDGYVVGAKAGTPGGPFIEGMNEGVVGMKVGGQRKLIVPAELAYGKRQVQEIPAGATLTFDVELLSIKDDDLFGKKSRRAREEAEKEAA